jgi:anti-sigma factor RsiW
MICLSANKQGADILLDYLGGSLDPARKVELERHVEECAECRKLLEVSARLDEWPAPEISSDFDARLYARIAQENAAQPWWRKFLWRPAVPLAAAGVVLVLALFVNGPDVQDAPKQVRPENTADILQAEQALEDLELLMPLDASSAGHASQDQASQGKM